MNHWTTPYLGIPFLEHGRDRAGCDCYGLLVLVYAELLGIELPAYSGAYLNTDERAEIASLIGARKHVGVWVAVEDPEPFDVALFRRGPYESHIGIVAAPGRMLHIPDDHAKIEDFRTGRWGGRLTGFYRHLERPLNPLQL